MLDEDYVALLCIANFKLPYKREEIVVHRPNYDILKYRKELSAVHATAISMKRDRSSITAYYRIHKKAKKYYITVFQRHVHPDCQDKHFIST